MNADRLIEGEFYWAEHRPDLDSKQRFTGKVMLMECHDPIKGWHRVCALDDNGVYYASSRGISYEIPAVKVVANSNNTFTTTSGRKVKLQVRSGNTVLPVADYKIDQLLDPIRPEVDKLRQLGYDDKTRSEELGKICLLLEGLGVKSKRLPDDTGVSIAWADLAVFKVLVQKLYMQDLMEF